jgi:peptide/nickel transport system ATP-binding protein
VKGLSFCVGSGEALGVIGESGCGKSLTMLAVLGLLPAAAHVTAGSARFDGRDLLAARAKERRQILGHKIGMVFQDPMTSFNPVMTIGSQVAEPLIYHLGLGRKEAWRRAGDLLELVGIPGGRNRLGNYPHELSGGMRQRVMIAIGIACNPNLLIADEPTTALDATIQAQIVELVQELRAQTGMAMIWITHDLALASGIVDRIVVLYAGKIVEEAPVDAIYDHPVHPYTRALLNSLPRLKGQPQRRLTTIGGTPPDPTGGSPGCAFAARCPLRQPRCLAQSPPLVETGTDHRAACWVTANVGAAA